MKAKVVLLPLDERPCNYGFPPKIFKETDIEVVTCDKAILGDKKKPADLCQIEAFLVKETKDAYGLVISIDMLLYGGIVPSRLHHETVEKLKERYSILRKLKEANPKLSIYAYDLIMRCPQYSSSDEEPDYYEKCGLEIFKIGYLENRIELGLTDAEEIKALNEYKKKVDPGYLDDFLGRRKTNLQLNLESLQYVNSGIIDFLIFPQDDSSEFGYTAKDQTLIRKEIDHYRLDFSVYMYPGADEVANVLLSRMLLHYLNRRPLVYIRYMSPKAPMMVPCLEDRYLDVSIRYQLLASGCLVATSASEADLILLVASGGDKMETGPDKNFNHSRSVNVLRNLIDGLEYADYAINVLKKEVILADITFLNGADLGLICLLDKRDLLFKLAAYAGWNTAANTLGTCIPQGIVTSIYGRTQAYYDFMTQRYLEDAMYCSIVRSKVTNKYLKDLGYNYFYVEETGGKVSDIVRQEIMEEARTYLPKLTGHYEIKRCYMPWRRMFEVGLEVEYHQ